MCSFNAPEITMVLNVEPGSITSLMTRSGSVFVLMVRRSFGSKVGQRCQRQNLARARAHHDAGDAFGRVFFHRIGEGGSPQCAGSPASMVSTTFRPLCACTSSSRYETSSCSGLSDARHAPAGRAAQFGVETFFNAVAAEDFRSMVRLFRRAHKTEHVRRQRAVRINPQLVRLGGNRILPQVFQKSLRSASAVFFRPRQTKAGSSPPGFSARSRP